MVNGKMLYIKKDAIKLYIIGCFLQICIATVFVFILRRYGFVVDYSSYLGMFFIILGGISSAMWGIAISIKYKRNTFIQIVKEFFDVKKAFKFYPIILFLLLVDFCVVFFCGKVGITKWYVPIFLFVKAIAFGGIEELGWRYTLQPMLQKKYGFIKSTLCIFLLWGVWHFLYFYIEGSLGQIDFFSFYIGLLTNCFLLGMIYTLTKSLWQCIFAHALINMLSQVFVSENIFVECVPKIIVIVLCIVFVKRCKR